MISTIILFCIILIMNIWQRNTQTTIKLQEKQTMLTRPDGRRLGNEVYRFTCEKIGRLLCMMSIVRDYRKDTGYKFAQKHVDLDVPVNDIGGVSQKYFNEVYTDGKDIFKYAAGDFLGVKPYIAPGNYKYPPDKTIYWWRK